METRITPNENNAWAQFLDGEISYETPPGVMTPDLAAELEADGFNVFTGISHLAWQATNGSNLNPEDEGKSTCSATPACAGRSASAWTGTSSTKCPMDGLAKPSVCNTSTESWAIREGANYYDPPDLAKAAQLRDAAGFGDDNPVTGDHPGLQLGTRISCVRRRPVFAQLQRSRLVEGLNVRGRL